MSIFKKAIAGFNHNVNHRNKLYHIQTEDSGVNNPHIITHLFVGGNILASKKTSYADILNTENLSGVVRELMEEQHKEMLRNLLNGLYDNPDGGKGRSQAYAPGQIRTDAGEVRMQAGVARSPAVPSPPARVAKASQPAASSEGLFGEDLISEKSLDEVILAYLAGEKHE
jgi:hypothetical protein